MSGEPRTRAPAPEIPAMPTRFASACASFVAVAVALSVPARTSAFGPRYALVVPRAFAVGNTTAIETAPTLIDCVIARTCVSRSIALSVTPFVAIALPSMNADVVAWASADASEPLPAKPATPTV